MTDGSVKVFTSSELSAIDFNDNGSITITTYDGQQLPALGADFTELTIGNEATVSEVYADSLSFNIDADGIPVNLHSDRAIMKVNYVYPSVDPFGQPITLSGTILIPEEIWKGEARSEGILMVNHYTKFHRDEAPTISNGELENMLLANPLKPHYIIVESDFYGFGSTVRFPQAFMQGMVNARASLDGLLSARELLGQMGLEYGPLCFNIGYSSGGFDALASQKLRDKEYADLISFDKTFSGGGPSDVREAYRQYVITDSTAYNAVPLLLMVCTNETQQLGIPYSDVFQPYISNRIDELILSKAYSSWPVCDSIGREKKVHEILNAPYCDLNSAESQVVQDLFAQNSIATGWVPDPSQRLFIFHSRGDDYVPVQSARPVLRHLEQYGFEPSIVPGRTHLQTNFVVPKLGHLTATVIYLIQSVAAIKAWPQMYADGELIEPYATWAQAGADFDLIATLRALDEMGIDCRSIIQAVIDQMQQGQGDTMNDIVAAVMARLAELGIDEQALREMGQDSGIDIEQLIADLVSYLNENPTQPEGMDVPARANAVYKSLTSPLTPADEYADQLRHWLESKGVATR